MPGLKIRLAGLEDTQRLGRCLAGAVAERNPGVIFLYGDLGAGKSALAGALARSLPGGGLAEPSSPSFTLCNIYCTVPPVHHFDLYRLPGGSYFEALEESLADAAVLTLVEWPENLAKDARPEDGVSLRLSRPAGFPDRAGPDLSDEERVAEIFAMGPAGGRFLRRLAARRLFSFNRE
ncbi:MAG: tRNA (adenosine(37)-N6)-threonylcarbamoyltransferase complex ATPase subunit type 1 TsaE [Desulfovibrio sp.]|jgi:tRNA threonylcarbamoyladenosine biosynthesis protein TsaE|nr:tRNA (adenosine(37)-N6)-threonylcarbamoyltransferase complex ATPase subunit type 1 TsaE [Desulfovibrio sp.]